MSDAPKITVLTGHVSPEAAYVIESYPYGGNLRCRKRLWLEHIEGRGVRMVSQTTNPKRGNIWNARKASTYARFAGCMYLDEIGHVQWCGLDYGTSGKATAAWIEKFGAGVPDSIRPVMEKWAALNAASEARKAKFIAAATGA